MSEKGEVNPIFRSDDSKLMRRVIPKGKTGFKSTYQDSQIKRYEKISKVYSNAITEYLKGPQTDNSELFILKAQADKIYNSFTKEELKKLKDLISSGPYKDYLIKILKK